MLLRPAVASLTLAALGVVAVGCGSDADPVEVVVQPAVTAVEDGLQAVDDASGIACDAERRTLEQAVDAFTLLEGDPPTDTDDLVPDWLREPPDRFEVLDGEVVATAGAGCD